MCGYSQKPSQGNGRSARTIHYLLLKTLVGKLCIADLDGGTDINIELCEKIFDITVRTRQLDLAKDAYDFLDKHDILIEVEDDSTDEQTALFCHNLDIGGCEFTVSIPFIDKVKNNANLHIDVRIHR